MSYIIGRKIFIGDFNVGWTSVIASIWLLGGITILFIGIIGVYIGKMFSEIKERPYVIVKKIYINKITKNTDKIK
jgi:putative glycosyltransferase